MSAIAYQVMKKYLFSVGLIAHLFVLFLGLVGVNNIASTGIPLPVFAEKSRQNIDKNYPSVASFVSPVLAGIASWKQDVSYGYVVDPLTWQGVGANVNANVGGEESPIRTLNSDAYNLTVIKVNSSASLTSALKHAQAGQAIEVLPGTYEIRKSRLNITHEGQMNFPIKVFAKKLGSVIVKLRGEGFVINRPHWQFENLHLIGNCTNHTYCEHAFHVVGNGNNVMFKNNIFQDFNAAIKINSLKGDYPDHGLVVGNTFYNTSIRQTANPVTPIDLMHANNWQVSENFILDFAKAKGNKISYGAFFKGGSNRGVFSNNLIMCNANLNAKTVAIGLSLGGGGSPDALHRDGNDYEHANGIISNNIIMNCANDVGIYLNKATNSTITHNILYNTLGVDVRFKESSATISNNVLSGRIKARNNGRIVQNLNNFVLSRSWLTAAEPLDDLFYAPVNGDFTWQVNAFEPQKDIHTSKHADFCGKTVSFPYVGAYAGTDFCKNSINLTNAKRQFKFTRDYEQHNEN